MNSCGYSFSKIYEYQVEKNKHTKLRAELTSLERAFPHMKDSVRFSSMVKKGRRTQSAAAPTDDRVSDTIECDLYLQRGSSNEDIPDEDNPDEETTSVECKELLKDSSTVVTLINPRDGESDVGLQRGDMVWIEVAEKPQNLREKLLQLERAVRHFRGQEYDITGGRGAVMICLNGEQGLFEKCLNHLRDLYNTGRLNTWAIFASRVPLFLVYTPYRNVHKSIVDLEKKLDKRMDKMERKMEQQMQTMQQQMQEVFNAVRLQQSETSAGPFSFLRNRFRRRANPNHG